MRTLEQYITPTQEELFAMLVHEYKDMAYVRAGSYILVEGEAPILLVAHLDTVHAEPVKHICKSKGGKILMSPQGIGGDDRCGVYALTSVYTRAEVKPWLLFTCDEETGGHGASAFCKDYHMADLPRDLDNLKIIVEIDRKGKNDAVYYDCDNPDFEDYITSKGFETDWGTFSDISLIAPSLGVAAVNLSSGYYNAHTLYEYIDRQELNDTIGKVLSIVSDASKADFPFYEYIEAVYTYSSSGTCYESEWYTWWKKYTEKRKEEEEEKDELKDVPAAIRNEYQALLEDYSKDELEHIRKEMGDYWITRLFEDQFGGTYEEVMDDYLKYADDDEDEEEEGEEK